MKTMILNIYLRYDYEIFEIRTNLYKEVNYIDISPVLIGMRDLSDDDEKLPEYWHYRYDNANVHLVTYNFDLNMSYYYK